MKASEHPLGAFCYMESGSIDVQSSHHFYRGLFGWGVEESPFPDGGSYTRFLMEGLPVAGFFSVDAGHPDLSALPTQWWPFVSVASLKEALRHAVELGAVPFGDVVEVPGEFSAVEIHDPSGAILGLWQAEAHIGSSYVDEVGALTWVDLVTPEPGEAAAFYGALFGWTVEHDRERETYKYFSSGGKVRAGLAKSDSGTAAWRAHVGVSDFVGATTAAVDLGGAVNVVASDVSGLGRRAEVRDPNGISLMVVETMA